MLPVVASRRGFSPFRLFSFFTVNLIWLAAFFLAPATAASAQIAVTTATDDPTTGTAGNCPGAACSLRDAILAANATPGSTVDLSGLGNATITLGAQLPAITANMTISGSENPNLLTVSGGGAFAAFIINPPAAVATTVTMSGFTVANTAGGGLSGYGSGLFIAEPGAAGTVTVNVTSMVFSGNSAGNGAAITADGTVVNTITLNVTGSTFSGNTVTSEGGAIWNGGNLYVTSSTFSSNYAQNQGSAILNENDGANFFGATTISDSTFANNSTPGSGAVYNTGGTLTIHDSTFSGNAPATGGSIAALGTLVITDNIIVEPTGTSTGCTSGTVGVCPANPSDPDANGNFDDTAAHLNLSSLAIHGGLTATLVPQTGSPVLCGGSTAGALTVGGAALTTDQRGFPLDPNCATNQTDSGSVQVGGSSFKVNTTVDSDDLGICNTTLCSLRDAITAANTAGQGDIDATGVSGTITLGSELPLVTGDLNITGPGAGSLTISGATKYRIMENFQGMLSVTRVTFDSGFDPAEGAALVNASMTSIDSVVFSNNKVDTANAGTGKGGAVYGTGTSSLFISNSTFANNSTGTGDNGGAIDSAGGLTVTDSTFSNNTAGNNGSAILDESDATVPVTYSTFSGNTAAGGGALAVLPGGALTVANDTFAGNTDAGGHDTGIYNDGATLSVVNSVLAEANECDSGTGCPTNKTAGNIVADVALTLAPLGSYGGPTMTLLPTPGSSAICGGLLADNPTGVKTDQRGFSNVGPASYVPANCVDSGSVQTDYTAVGFNAAAYNGSVNVDGATPQVIVSVTENNQNIGGVPLTLITGGTAGTPTGVTATTVGGVGATFSALAFPAQGTGDLSVSVTVVSTDVLAAGPFPITIGAGGTVATTTTEATPTPGSFVVSATATPVTLSATVAGTPTVSEGYVTFTVHSGSVTGSVIGTAVGPVAVTGGATGTVTYSIPANTLAGTYYVVAAYSDPGGATGYASSTDNSKTIVITPVLAAATAIPTTTLTKNVAATPFTPVTASGGTPPYTFAIVAPPALPTLLSISSSTGAISGTPNATSVATVYTVKVTDSTTATATATFTLTVNAPTITIAPTTLTAATVGVAFTAQQLTASGGVGPYTYAVTAGALPAGTALSTGGSLSGTPTAGGAFNFTVTATDADANVGSQIYNWTVNSATIVVLPAAGTLNATTNINYTQTFTATGGTTPYTWTQTGTLPTGILWNAATATLSGKPTGAPGSFPITIKATDSSTGTGPYNQSNNYTLVVGAPAITIAPTTLAAVAAGTAVSQQLTASGGATPYTYAVTVGALPAGITLSTAGLLSGKPTAANAFGFTVTATDTNLNTGTQAYAWTINPPALTLAPVAGNLPVTAEVAYTQTFTSTGGNTPYTFVETGALPTGITWNAATATLSGTATASGSFPITIKVTDSTTGTGSPFSVTNNYTLVVTAPTIAVAPATLATATAGTAYTSAITASGGVGPYTFTVTTGALPAGLTLATSGALTGTPTAAGALNFTVTAKDTDNFTGSTAYTLTVNAPALALLPAAGTLNAAAEAAYTQTFTTTGGNTPYTYVETGALPTGITWNAATATLSGTATASGSFPITVKVTDSSTGTGSPFSVTNAYTLTVSAPTITVAPATLTAATAAAAYTATITASGGAGPYTFTVTTGALPAGLTLATSGALTGTPTAAGTFNFTVTAKDADNFTGSTAYTLTVNAPAIALLPAAGTLTATGEVAYTQTFTASGGTAPYAFVETGALPAGITWNAATATLSGTATASGSFPITIKVTDSSTGTGSPFSVTNAYTLTITAPTIAVAPTTLTAPAIGIAYTSTITASGGVGPYTFTVTTGALPAGLTLATSGALTGTPTAAGTFNFTVTAKDADNFTGTRAYSVTVNAPTIALLPAAGTLTATGEVAYTQTFTASGGTGPYTFVETGALPTGITWNAATATLSGTPTASGSFPITVKVTDSSTGTGSPFSVTNNYTLTVNGPTITVAPATLPAATIATAYTATITATGGAGPYTFTVTTGALPAGLTLATSGALTGTPTAAGTFNFTATAKDTDNFTGSTAYTLVVNAATLTLLPAQGTLNATGETAFTQIFTASGGTGPYTYIETGALPAGITWNAATATLSGTATVSGSFPITIKATDSSTGAGAPFTVTNNYTLTVSGPTIAVSPATLSAATIATAYTATFTATGGVAPYTFTVTTGALPAGLTLATSGALTGTPTAGGTFNFTVTAKDTDNFTAGQAYSLTVNGPTISLLPAAGTLTAIAEAAFTETFTASGGIAPYTYTETGALPAGITFDAATGVLSGTPTVSGSFPITVKAIDSSTGAGPYSSAAVAYTLTVGTAAVTVTWANPAAITYGTNLAAILNATASFGGNPVAGTFAYTATPTGGTVTTATILNAGSYTLTATFTPSNTAYGAPAPKTVPLTVNQAQPTLAWTPATTIGYGTSLSALLNATASFGGNAVAGSFAYTATPTGGTATAVTGATVLTEGTYTLGVTFTPTSTTNYNTATGTSPLTVTGQTLTVSANNATKVYGTANPTFTGSVTGAVNGDTFTETFSTTATATSTVGAYPIVPAATGANLSDYTVVVDDGSLTVTQAGTTTTLTASSNSINPGASVTLTATVASATTGTPTGTVSFYNGSTLLGTGTLAAGTSGDVATLATTALPSGSQTITAVYGGDGNFSASSTTGSITITVAPLGLILSASPLTQTGNAGSTFTYQLSVAPAFAGTPYPGTVTFAAAGGPTGAVITFSPTSLAANAGPQTVSMSVATSSSTAAVQPLSTGRKLIPVAFALFLLPLAGTRRMRRNGQKFSRYLGLLLLVLAGVAATTALSGCGSNPGGKTGTAYTINVTATSGSVTQTTAVTVTVN